MNSRFSSAQLDAFAREHISYEIEMAANGAAMWRSARAFLSRPASSALTVAVLVHLRLLDDFSGKATSPHDDDVLAVDYLSTWKPAQSKPLADVRDAINAQVAHLSMRRQAHRQWDLAEQAENVLVECQRFLHQLEVEGSPYAVTFESSSRIVAEYLDWFAAVRDASYESEAVNVEAASVFASDLATTTSDTTTGIFLFPGTWVSGS